MQKLTEALIKWTPSGLGLGVTVHALLTHNWAQAAITALLTGCTSLWVKFSSGFMKEAEQEAEKRGGGFAKWLFIIFDKLAIAFWKRLSQLWWNLTANFEGKYYQWLVDTCRNLEPQGFIEQSLPLKEVFVPLKIHQRSLSGVPSNPVQPLSKQINLPGQKEIGDLLALINPDTPNQRFVIIGAPGSGKTTLLRYLNLVYANRNHRSLHPKAPRLIPVLIRLRDEYKIILNNPQQTLSELIVSWVNRLQQEFHPDRTLQIPQDWFAERLREQKCLVMLDGLDEVPEDQQRQQISQWVDRQMRAYPKAPFIITSRRPGYEKARLEQDVTVLAVQPFNLEQVEQFIHNWYLASEIRWEGKEDPGVRREAQRQAKELFDQIRQNVTLQDLATNPLLLTLIAKVHRGGNSLPQNRIGLYKEICQVLLERRQRAKGLPSSLSSDQKQSILQPLSLLLMQQQQVEFTLEQVRELLEGRLSRIGSKPLTPELFLQQVREVDALIARDREGVYEFAHLSFQEYLAAVEIKETNQEGLLLEVFQNQEKLSWWTETIRLYSAQADASNLINAALDNPTVEAITLAYDCLSEGFAQPEIRTRFNVQLEQWLESTDPQNFELAAKAKLARRLRDEQLQPINDESAIDRGYITRAEYQLFLNYKQRLSQDFRFQSQESQVLSSLSTRILPGTANEPIKSISFHEAEEFCNWLSTNNPINENLSRVSLYRLPTNDEVEQYTASDHLDLSCITKQSFNSVGGIRVVKVRIQLQSRFLKLYNYLSSQQWKEANQETFKLISQGLKQKNQQSLSTKGIKRLNCEDLRVIDELWAQFSNGNFGFSIQKQIWMDVGGSLTQDQPYQEVLDIFVMYGERAEWLVSGRWIDYSELSFSIDAPPGHLPRLRPRKKMGGEFGFRFFTLLQRATACGL